jgi:hypothetical protein
LVHDVTQHIMNDSHHLFHHHHTAGPDDGFLEGGFVGVGPISVPVRQQDWKYHRAYVPCATLGSQKNFGPIRWDLNGFGDTKFGPDGLSGSLHTGNDLTPNTYDSTTRPTLSCPPPPHTHTHTHTIQEGMRGRDTKAREKRGGERRCRERVRENQICSCSQCQDTRRCEEGTQRWNFGIVRSPRLEDHVDLVID